MLLTLTTLTLALDPAALTARLKAIAADRGDHYKCKIGIGVQSSTLSLAATSDGDVDERFVWGSVTKLLTGSGILRQVEKGNLKLDGPAAPHIDPVLSALGLGSMVELLPGGAQVPLSYDRRMEYVELVQKARLLEGERQVIAFQRGLTSVIPASVLRLCSWQDLSAWACDIIRLRM